MSHGAHAGGMNKEYGARNRSIQFNLADKTNPDHVGAPFAGVVTLQVAEGDTVEAGDTVATIEAMKMEASITAPKGGTVQRVAIGSVQQVEGGDLLVVLS